jgi:hypothetical protein
MLPALVVLLFYALHQDVWFWREARPLVFGVLPVGLAWHAAYTLAVPLLMAFLIRRLWPAHLEDAGHPLPDSPDDGSSGSGRKTSAGPATVPAGPERAR